ncbi:hypothetical protein [Actinoplanes sp. CA-252034]|uniref:hypothetical protein n=1 Tax=Actinoplanes sp. CA-252034 TaxID=3239906 RepID=UPI003D994AD7
MKRRLERLRQRAEELGRLAAEAHSVVPESAPGVDESECVRIRLGPDRVPLQIQIRERWQDRLDADALADAVMDANTDAVRRAYRAWSDRLDESGWWRRQRDADEMPERRPMPMASPPPREPRTGHIPEDPEMGERILRLLQDTRRSASDRGPVEVEGSNDSGSVSVRLSVGGLAGCVIDEGWARHRCGDDIATALSHALRRARRRLDSPRPGLLEADALISEALTALTACTGTEPAGSGER